MKSVGNGLNTFFWTDCWVGSISLRERFKRLYNLSIYQGLTVGEMHALGWGDVGEAWGWSRLLLAWEEELVGEMKLLLSNVSEAFSLANKFLMMFLLDCLLLLFG